MFFSSAVSLMVRVDHLPEALLGLRPLGFLPLTTPLPRTYYWLTLFHWFVLNGVQGWWIPTAITWSSTHVKAVKQTTVKVDTSRTLLLSSQHFDWVFHKREPTIRGDIIWVIHHRQEREDEKSFFCRVFLLLQNFVVGLQYRFAGYERRVLLLPGVISGLNPSCLLLDGNHYQWRTSHSAAGCLLILSDHRDTGVFVGTRYLCGSYIEGYCLSTLWAYPSRTLYHLIYHRQLPG